MTIRTKAATKEYRDGWDRVFGRHGFKSPRDFLSALRRAEDGGEPDPRLVPAPPEEVEASRRVLYGRRRKP